MLPLEEPGEVEYEPDDPPALPVLPAPLRLELLPELLRSRARQSVRAVPVRPTHAELSAPELELAPMPLPAVPVVEPMPLDVPLEPDAPVPPIPVDPLEPLMPPEVLPAPVLPDPVLPAPELLEGEVVLDEPVPLEPDMPELPELMPEEDPVPDAPEPAAPPLD